MYCCIAYDISNNRLRLRVSKMCRKAGLVRLQKSVFVGDTGANLINDLENAIKPILPTTDRFAVMPLDRQTYIDLINGSRLPSAGTAGEAFVQWEF